MDYPRPLAELHRRRHHRSVEGLHQNIGEWDKVAINYGYREFPKAATTSAALDKILDDAWAADLRYFTNQDTDIHPKVDQWSNGANQADELTRLDEGAARRARPHRQHTIRTGVPTVMIEEPLVPIYMYHRYAVESTASMIGGQDFIYAMRGDNRTPVEWVKGEMQRKAIDALTATLKPSELTIPKRILDLIPPRPPGYGMHRELFPRTTGEGFDPIDPARSPPTSRSASSCSPIAPRAWWRSTPSISHCRDSVK